jgi:hypothetical protein
MQARVCPECKGGIKCLGGKPAHESNWFCMYLVVGFLSLSFALSLMR